jgi:hypothetical protein
MIELKNALDVVPAPHAAAAATIEFIPKPANRVNP